MMKLLLSCTVWFCNCLAKSLFGKRAIHSIKLTVEQHFLAQWTFFSWLHFIILINDNFSILICDLIQQFFITKYMLNEGCFFFVFGDYCSRSKTLWNSLRSNTLNSCKISASCANVSSVSWVESCWLCFEIHTFLKQFMIFISDSVNHDWSSIIIASSIGVFVNSLLKSIALMYLRITFVRYLDFNDRIQLDPLAVLLRFHLVVRRWEVCQSIQVRQLWTKNATLPFWGRKF